MRKGLILLSIICLVSCKQDHLTYSNVVIILADDMGYGDLACFESEVNTTLNLGQRAREGSKFTSFYAAQAVC